MNVTFVQFVGEHIRKRIETSHVTRCVFRGPSGPMLDELGGYLEEQVSEHWQICVLVPEGEERTISSKHGRLQACTAQTFMSMRNSYLYFIGLIPEGMKLNESLTSAVAALGVSEENHVLSKTHEWARDPFVHEIIEGALGQLFPQAELFGGPVAWDKWVRTIKRALTEHGEAARAQGLRSGERWHLLSRLFTPKDQFPHLSANEIIELACGLIRGSTNLGERDTWRLLESVHEKLQGSLDDFFADIELISDEGSLDRQTRNSIAELSERVSDDSSAFVSQQVEHPAAVYAPTLDAELTEAPEWWYRLDESKWSSLLSRAASSQSHIRASIECVNYVTAAESGLPWIVKSDVELRVRIEGALASQTTFEVLRGRNRKLVHQFSTDASDDVPLVEDFVDENPPTGRTHVRYYVREVGREKEHCYIDIVPIEGWVPGLVVFCQQAKKIAIPKAKPKNVAGRHTLQSSVSLNSFGRFKLRALFSPSAELQYKDTPIVVERSGKLLSEDEIEKLEWEELSGKFDDVLEYGLDFEVDDSIVIEIPFSNIDAQGKVKREKLRVTITADDVSNNSVASVFEQLVAQHRDGELRPGVMPSLSIQHGTFLDYLEKQMTLESQVVDSWRPLIIGPDAREFIHHLDWTKPESTTLTSHLLTVDYRPKGDRLVAPATYEAARAKVINAVLNSDKGLRRISAIHLSSLNRGDQGFKDDLIAYLRSYQAWYQASPQDAGWADCSLIYLENGKGDGMAKEPVAALMSPFHPIRLAWQFCAQDELETALQQQAWCPAASLLNPNNSPDSIGLWFDTDSTDSWESFFAVETSDSHWAVLWNAREFDRLAEASGKAPFNDDFGLDLGGAHSLFSSSQVQRALNDLSDVLCAKSALTVGVRANGTARGNFNDGVQAWSLAQFAGDKSELLEDWSNRRLNIIDRRYLDANRKDNSQISHIVAETGGRVQWFSDARRREERRGARSQASQSDYRVDLLVLEQLSAHGMRLNISPDSAACGLGIGGLVRAPLMSLKKRAEDRSRVQDNLIVSRTAVFGGESGEGDLLDLLAEVIAEVERYTSSLAESSDTDSAVRRLQYSSGLDEVFGELSSKTARMIAISSSSLDAACFTQDSNDSYFLWEYELPEYSKNTGANSGYYVLAEIDEAELNGVQAAIERVLGVTVKPDVVKRLVWEISARGIPTVRGVKQPTSKGTGDVATMVAARVLQDSFAEAIEDGTSVLKLFESTGPSGDAFSLLIPLDPFEDRLKQFRNRLNTCPDAKHSGDLSSRRPDILVITVDTNGSAPWVRITPVEVKCRTTSQFAGTKSASAQIDGFNDLIKAFARMACKHLIWRLALQRLICDMVTFGFRLYSQTTQAKAVEADWDRCHGQLLRHIMSPQFSFELSTMGRIVAVDDADVLRSAAIDCTTSATLLGIPRRMAAAVLSGEFPDELRELIKKLDGWGLWPGSPDGELIQLSRATADAQEGSLGSDKVSAEPKVNFHFEAATAEQELVMLDETEVIDAGSEPSSDTMNVDALMDTQSEVDVVEGSKGIEIELGSSTLSKKPVFLNLSDTSLNQMNIGIIGDLGTGKTQLIKSMITQLVHSGPHNRGIRPRVLIFDYKRDFSDPEFVEATGAKVYDLYNLPLTPFSSVKSGRSWRRDVHMQAVQFRGSLRKIYPSIGPVQAETVRDAVAEAYSVSAENGHDAPLLSEVLKAYEDAGNEKADSVSSVLSDFINLEIFTEDRSEIQSFDDFFDGPTVVSLSEHSDGVKSMVVSLILDLLYEHMKRSPKLPFVGSSPQLRAVQAFLLVDEAHHIMEYDFDPLQKILLEGREFGFGVILASQYLSHFQKARGSRTDLRQNMLSWFLHKNPNVKRQDIEGIGVGDKAEELVSKLKSVPNFHAWYKDRKGEVELIRTLPFFEYIKRSEES